MAPVSDTKVRVRLTDENLRALKELNSALPFPYTINQLANFVIREHLKIMDGKPKKK